jgi:thiol-disulfide isomerase/thioredoxin
MMKKFIAAGIAVLLFPAFAAAAELAIGADAPAFNLVNAVDGESVAFEPGDGKVSVLVFTCNQCPYAKAFQGRLNDIANEYAKKGVTFYAINPNDDEMFAQETIDNMKARALEQKYPFAYLKDGDSSVARAYGARVTPHVFLVDGSGKLRYRGFIDDSAKPEQRTKTGLSDALDAVLAKSAPAEAVTREFGCTIKWKTASAE